MFPVSVMELDLFSAGHCQAVLGSFACYGHMFPCWVAQDLSWSLKVVMATIACYGLLIFALCNSLLWACASTCYGFVIFVRARACYGLFDLCVIRQPVMGMCNSLLGAFDLCYTVGRSCVLRGMTVTPVISVPCLLCTVALAGSLAKFC